MTLYYDAFLCGLVACKVLEVNPDNTLKVKVTARKNRYYKCGEILSISKAALVLKTRVRSYHQLVKTAIQGVDYLKES